MWSLSSVGEGQNTMCPQLKGAVSKGGQDYQLSPQRLSPTHPMVLLQHCELYHFLLPLAPQDGWNMFLLQLTAC